MRGACALGLISLLVACGGPQQPLRVRDAWLRVPPPGAAVTAAYMTIQNHTDETRHLVQVTSPEFGRAELHETRLDNGMVRMRAVQRLVLPPGASVALAPGGLHLMLFDPVQPLAAHDHVLLRLQFDDGWTYEVEAEVRAQ